MRSEECPSYYSTLPILLFVALGVAALAGDLHLFVAVVALAAAIRTVDSRDGTTRHGAVAQAVLAGLCHLAAHVPNPERAAKREVVGRRSTAC